MTKIFIILNALLFLTTPTFGEAYSQQLDSGLKALSSMQGCYIVDYSYVETEAVKEGYIKDPRVYDVNKTQTVKEWIQLDPISDTRVRLLHILFSTSLYGKVVSESMIKHQFEDWEYGAPFLYEFKAPRFWQPKVLENRNQWTRKITNLDDGLRYQCAAPFSTDKAAPEWACANYAPIPGRETRDMGRKDYQTLDRFTKLVLYGNSWLERQENIKTIHQGDQKIPLAKELGKNWYVRVADEECAEAKMFAAKRQEFWTLLREIWDEVLDGKSSFIETQPAGKGPRFGKIWEIEESYLDKDLKNLAIRGTAQNEILDTINLYRQP